VCEGRGCMPVVVEVTKGQQPSCHVPGHIHGA
jgi:hypothetical protein